MISDKLYELGHMLGLKQKDIQYLILNKQETEISLNIIPSMELYKVGTLYGTICINDF